VLLLLLALGCPGQPKTPPQNTDEAVPPPTAADAAPAAPADAAPEAAAPADAAPEAAAAPTVEAGPTTAADATPEVAASAPRVSAAGAALYGVHYVVTAGPTLSRTTLSLSARHGGGCEEHHFTLRADPRSEETPTTQVLHLHHDDGGDRCRALLTTVVSLDVADHIGADCTERIEIRTWPQDTAQSSWTLDMKTPMGCD